MRVDIFEDRAGEWRWRFIADNGRIIATSGEGFATANGAGRALEGVVDAVLESHQAGTNVAVVPREEGEDQATEGEWP